LILPARACSVTKSCLVNEEIVNAVIGLTAVTLSRKTAKAGQTSRMTRSTFEVRDESELMRRTFYRALCSILEVSDSVHTPTLLADSQGCTLGTGRGTKHALPSRRVFELPYITIISAVVEPDL